jgi:hypothetical protein
MGISMLSKFERAIDNLSSIGGVSSDITVLMLECNLLT